MPRVSEVVIEADHQSSSGYALCWEGYREDFGTPESIERFHPVTSFRFISTYGDFVARREMRGSHYYWYGFKRFGDHIHKVYLGRTHRLTLHSLEVAAVDLYERKAMLPNCRPGDQGR